VISWSRASELIQQEKAYFLFYSGTSKIQTGGNLSAYYITQPIIRHFCESKTKAAK